MRRIAHRKIRRDRERFDVRGMFGDRLRQRLFIERRGLLSAGAMTARDAHDAAAAAALQSGALDHAGIESDQQRAYGTEAVFDDGVGRQRRRYRDQRHRGAIRAGRQPLQNRANRVTDADLEVPMGRQRLGARNHLPAAREQHGVGIGAARVQAEPQVPSRRRRTARQVISVHCVHAAPRMLSLLQIPGTVSIAAGFAGGGVPYRISEDFGSARRDGGSA